MKTVFIRETKTTPAVSLDHESGTLMILGKSTMDDPRLFYEPIKKWVEEYVKKPAKETKFIMFQELSNSLSGMEIINIIIKLSHSVQNTILKIFWLYPDDDEDAEETGYDINDVINLSDFKLIGVPNQELMAEGLTETALKCIKMN